MSFPAVSGRRRRRSLEMADTIATSSDAPPAAGFVRMVMPVLVGGETWTYYEFNHELPSRDEELRRRHAAYWEADDHDLDLAYPFLQLHSRNRKRARVPASSDAIEQGLRVARAGDAGMPGECAVCLEDFNANADETLRVMPSCSHAFHPDCILSWLRIKAVCPLCRQALPTQQQQHEDQDEDDEEDSDEDDSDVSDEDEDEDDATNYQVESTPAVPDPEES